MEPELPTGVGRGWCGALVNCVIHDHASLPERRARDPR